MWSVMTVCVTNERKTDLDSRLENARENYFTILSKKACQFTYNKVKQSVECHDHLCHK